MKISNILYKTEIAVILTILTLGQEEYISGAK